MCPPKAFRSCGHMNDQRIIQAHKDASRWRSVSWKQFPPLASQGGVEDKDRTTGESGRRCVHAHVIARARSALHTHFRGCSRHMDKTEQRWKLCKRRHVDAFTRHGSLSQRTGSKKNACINRLFSEPRQTAGAFEIEGRDPSSSSDFPNAPRNGMLPSQKRKAMGRRLTKNEATRRPSTRPKKIEGCFDEQVRQQQLEELAFLRNGFYASGRLCGCRPRDSRNGSGRMRPSSTACKRF